MNQDDPSAIKHSISQDTVLNRLDKVPPATVLVLGVQLPLNPLSILFDNLELLFGGILHPLVLILQQVSKIHGPFFNLGPDGVMGEFLEFALKFLNGVLLYLFLLSQILLLYLQDFLPGFRLPRLDSLSLFLCNDITLCYFLHFLLHIVVHQSLLMTLACLNNIALVRLEMTLV